MGQHDEYGKRLMKDIAGDSYDEHGESVGIDYGAGLPARIDGTVAGRIAIEIESRVSKQIRGAVLDLICHPFEKKLLVILPAHANNPEVSAKQCENIMSRFLELDDFRVVLAVGTGDKQMFKEDKVRISKALSELGFKL